MPVIGAFLNIIFIPAYLVIGLGVEGEIGHVHLRLNGVIELIAHLKFNCGWRFFDFLGHCRSGEKGKT